uniref:Lysophospholipid acyltransferase 7 n=1 Tax=Vitrella brassicaformis TaxID=1169539 RepID=A0A7S1P4T0_9ALVE|mmetsp:Transcript_32775/g.81183  ORF Transcript_32775/g.81183 Transcript_32775/m.81183 type:complete len:473 (+) Transcript_32775:184-1602(+)
MEGADIAEAPGPLSHSALSEPAFLYPATLFGAFSLSFALPALPTSSRRLFSSLVGAIIWVLMFQSAVWMPILLSLVCYGLTRLLYRRRMAGCVVIALAFCFANLMRIKAMMGWLPLPISGDLAFYMFTLRLGTFAFHAEDSQAVPPLTCFMSFMLFFPGIWSGPTLSWRAVQDTFDNPNTKARNFGGFLLKRGYECSMHWLAYLLLPRFNVAAVLEPAFLEHSFWYRLFYINIVLLVKKAEILFCWFIAECTCAAAGVGCDTSALNGVNNDVFMTYNPTLDWSQNIREVIKKWNSSVQTWMALNVYKRLPIKIPLLRKLVTTTISAFWHGWDAGYYLAFSLYPVFELSQDLVWRYRWPMEDRPIMAKFYQVVRWIVSQTFIHYSQMPFVFFTFSASFIAWRAVSYYGFWVMGFFFIMGAILPHTGLEKREPSLQMKQQEKSSSGQQSPEGVKRSLSSQSTSGSLLEEREKEQ